MAEGQDRGQHSFTKGGNLRPPSRQLIAQWVKSAWDKVPKDVIVKSFLVCGISGKIDGSLDDQINVIKQGAIFEGERDNILKDLSEVTFDNELDVHEEEDIEEEFVVHDDDSTDSDDDDNIPLARFQ
jgi:hypothetical protein